MFLFLEIHQVYAVEEVNANVENVNVVEKRFVVNVVLHVWGHDVTVFEFSTICTKVCKTLWMFWKALCEEFFLLWVVSTVILWIIFALVDPCFSVNFIVLYEF